MNNYLKSFSLKLYSSILAVCFIAIPIAMADDSERHQHTNNAVSFGNFFPMSAPGQYKIRVEIQHPGVDGIAVANFIYERPRD